MKRFVFFLIISLFLTACSGTGMQNGFEMSPEQVQTLAQQTINARDHVVSTEAPAASSSGTGGFVVRPVSTMGSGGLIIHPTATPYVKNFPTVAPTVPTTSGNGGYSSGGYSSGGTNLYPYQQQQTRPQQQVQPYYPVPNQPVCDLVRFLDDGAVPDGTVFQPGQPFHKTWRVQNAGSCTWDRGYSLIFTGGEVMARALVVSLPQEVRPGGVVELGVDMVAPNEPGTYQMDWKLRSSSGNIFGTAAADNSALWAKIVVSKNGGQTGPQSYFPGSGCTMISVQPANGSKIRRGSEFDIYFKVRNDSTTPWDADNFDVSFIGGENLLKRKNQTRKDLPYTIDPGAELYFGIDAVAPDQVGTYTMTMGVARAFEVFCNMDVTIQVIN